MSSEAVIEKVAKVMGEGMAWGRIVAGELADAGLLVDELPREQLTAPGDLDALVTRMADAVALRITATVDEAAAYRSRLMQSGPAVDADKLAEQIFNSASSGSVRTRDPQTLDMHYKGLSALADAIRAALMDCTVPADRVLGPSQVVIDTLGLEATLGSSLQAIVIERHRAHEKHSATGRSAEQMGADDPIWLAVLTEEVGEVARALCDSEDQRHLSKELIQVAAMASAWADAIERAGGGESS